MNTEYSGYCCVLTSRPRLNSHAPSEPSRKIKLRTNSDALSYDDLSSAAALISQSCHAGNKLADKRSFWKKTNQTKQKQPQRKTRWRQRSTADVKAPRQNIHVYQIIQNIIPITNKPHCELRGMWNVRVIVSFSKQNPAVCTSGFCDMIRLYFWLLWHKKKKNISIYL